MPEKIKRNDRMAAMAQVLCSTPNRIYPFTYFCDMFDTARSTVSEDVDLLEKAFSRFSLGRVETVIGAAGGVRYRPVGGDGGRREALEEICVRLSEPDRLLPGGYLYQSDVFTQPESLKLMAEIIAGASYYTAPDVVLTMETKGIPLAMMTAQAMGVPLRIARHTNKVYEGSTVSISYVSANGRVDTMSLSRRAVREGGRALIVDDFMRGGGTVRGLISLMREFNVEVTGIRIGLAVADVPMEDDRFKSLMTMSGGRGGEPLCLKVADWVR